MEVTIKGGLFSVVRLLYCPWKLGTNNALALLLLPEKIITCGCRNSHLLGNIDPHPEFITPADPAAAPTTSGSLHLQSGSPAIYTGEVDFIAVKIDLDNKPHMVDGDFMVLRQWDLRG
jgi:hypothetical protein